MLDSAKPHHIRSLPILRLAMSERPVSLLPDLRPVRSDLKRILNRIPLLHRRITEQKTWFRNNQVPLPPARSYSKRWKKPCQVALETEDSLEFQELALLGLTLALPELLRSEQDLKNLLARRRNHPKSRNLIGDPAYD